MLVATLLPEFEGSDFTRNPIIKFNDLILKWKESPPPPVRAYFTTESKHTEFLCKEASTAEVRIQRRYNRAARRSEIQDSVGWRSESERSWQHRVKV